MTPGLRGKVWMAGAWVTSGSVLSIRTEYPDGWFGLDPIPAKWQIIIVGFFFKDIVMHIIPNLNFLKFIFTNFCTKQQEPKECLFPCAGLFQNATLNGWWAKDERLLKRLSAAKLCTSCLQGNARMYHRWRRWSQSLDPETQRQRSYYSVFPRNTNSDV